MKIPPGWELPPGFATRLGERSGHQRAMLGDDQLLLILHRVPSSDAIEREGVLFWRSAKGEWKCSAGGNGLTALRAHVEAYWEAVTRLEADYDRAQTSHDYFHLLERVVPIHRAAVNMKATLQAAREALPDAREIISLRDLAGDVERTSELLQTDAKYALDYRIAQQSEEQARLANQAAQAGNRLNIVAALCLPLTAITGVFGMNLPNGLEEASPFLFWSIFGLGALFGIVLSVLIRSRNS